MAVFWIAGSMSLLRASTPHSAACSEYTSRAVETRDVSLSLVKTRKAPCGFRTSWAASHHVRRTHRWRSLLDLEPGCHLADRDDSAFLVAITDRVKLHVLGCHL